MVFRASVEFHVSDVSGYNFMSIALSSIEYLVDLVYVQTRGFQTYEGIIINGKPRPSGQVVPLRGVCGDRFIKPSASKVPSNPAIGGVTIETPEVNPAPKGGEGVIYNYHAFLAKLVMLSYAFTVPMPSTARISEYELSIARRYLGSAGSGGWLTPSYYFRSWWLGKSRSATEDRAGVLMWARQETYYDEEPGAVEATLPTTLMF